MSEFKPQQIAPPISGPVPPNTPTVYADGILSFANTGHVAKMYFARFDSSAADINQAYTNVTVQIIMPLDGLLNMYSFLEKSVLGLIQEGVLSADDLNRLRAARAGQ